MAADAKQIVFTQSWQLNFFKQELKKKSNSFYATKARKQLTRPPIMPVDSQSRKFVSQKVDELGKNHRADDYPYDTPCDGRMYEKPESALCPVKCFEL